MLKSTMHFKIVFLFLASFLSATTYGQVFKGKIVDEQKSVALPYANIGVRGKSIGGITDEKGNFSIDLSQANPNDSVVISYLGYRSKSFVKHEISPGFQQIKLTPFPYQLDEVVARGKREIIIIGNKDHSQRYTGWGDYSSSKGRLRGLAIEPDEVPLQLSRFVMRLHDNTFDSVRIRLHILPLKTSAFTGTDSELLKENLFVTCKKNQKWVYIDLKPYNIILTAGVVVAAEWVDSWAATNPASGESNLLTISTAGKEGYFYLRKTPEEPFTVTREKFSPTMYFETFRVGNASK